ncbi:MAG: F0F1 ATP synthase subunit A [Proteobacteria bacterium]|nr:F0F1 ATP synthase subunit A [Pseudomonadota bacterium]
MTGLVEIKTLTFQLFGVQLTVNIATIWNTWLVMAILIILAFLATRRLERIPNPLQRVMEIYVSAMNRLVREVLEEESRGYFALAATMFLFLFLSNCLGIIPGLTEPTRDLNTPLSLGIMGFFLTHTAAVREKGFFPYMAEFARPFFIMLPLNIVGELAKVVSISFRLFGNIFGGAIIITVVSPLVYHLILPPFLTAFFGLFIGVIQAFVFTMLTITYIAVATK